MSLTIFSRQGWVLVWGSKLWSTFLNMETVQVKSIFSRWFIYQTFFELFIHTVLHIYVHICIYIKRIKMFGQLKTSLGIVVSLRFSNWSSPVGKRYFARVCPLFLDMALALRKQLILHPKIVYCRVNSRLVSAPIKLLLLIHAVMEKSLVLKLFWYRIEKQTD